MKKVIEENVFLCRGLKTGAPFIQLKLLLNPSCLSQERTQQTNSVAVSPRANYTD
jgi:hypothetical protein